MATRITNSGQHRTLLTSVQIIFNYRAALSRFQLLNYVSRPQGGWMEGGSRDNSTILSNWKQSPLHENYPEFRHNFDNYI